METVNPKPYIPRPWQLPHMLATPIGGKVLMVERCEHSSPEAKSAVHDMLKDRWAFRSQELEIDGRINFELIECQDDRYNVSPWFECPLGPVGTVLACKERFLPCKGTGDEHPIKPSEASYVCFRDGSQKFRSGKYYQQTPVEYQFNWPAGAIWRPARSMPLWACRLFFRTTAIDLRRVNSMTDNEALAWGCRPQTYTQVPSGYGFSTPVPLDVPPVFQARRHWEADNPGAKWGEWAWFRTAESVERC